MKLSDLKKIRIFFSLLFFLLTGFLFLNFIYRVNPLLFDTVIYLQFIPSLVNFINVPSLFVIGFAIVLLSTFFLGRVYCSTVCPLGTLQDLIIYSSNKLSKKKKSTFEKEKKILRYSFFFLTLLSPLFFSILIINLLDPFSSFGKILTNIFQPILIFINNTISYFLFNLNNYSVPPTEFRGVELPSVIFSLFLFFTILTLALLKGRLYCNTVCPVGTLLGLIAKVSFLKIAVDESSCSGCGVCQYSCKANCIDKSNKSVDYSRCVNCFNCFTACKTDGIVFERRYKRREKRESVDQSKRKFLFDTGLYSFSVATFGLLLQKIIVYKKTLIPESRTFPVSPPGSVSLDHFNSNCTACHLCVSVCPTKVLQPSYLEYGLLGFLQPRMDFIKNFCNFECKLCADVCPTDAIKKIDIAEKKLVQIGKVKFIKDNCIVVTQGTECGACSEHCPTKAVYMIPYKNLFLPELKVDYCIGCGACEFACPTIPYKSIYIDGNEFHQKAVMKKEEELKKEFIYKEEFPF
ncbi:MAG: 4Fe-4S ferredoxin [Chlorobiaceae bacterium]|nr:4Fe-4S ferredoxin [Chlorobiaceae bacterium]MBA4310071.1 4Fe-4S ferredoxin [Chlorobiaceae bacterium]